MDFTPFFMEYSTSRSISFFDSPLPLYSGRTAIRSNSPSPAMIRKTQYPKRSPPSSNTSQVSRLLSSPSLTDSKDHGSEKTDLFYFRNSKHILRPHFMNHGLLLLSQKFDSPNGSSNGYFLKFKPRSPLLSFRKMCLPFPFRLRLS